MSDKAATATGESITIREEVRREAERTIKSLKEIGEGKTKSWDEVRDKYLD